MRYKSLSITLAAAAMLSLCVGCGTDPGGAPSGNRPPLAISPSSASVAVNSLKDFVINGADPVPSSATWSLTQGGNPCSPGCGRVSNALPGSTTYMAPMMVPSNPIVTLNWGFRSDTFNASATITITGPTITVAPSSVSVGVNGSHVFNAAISPSAAVTWSLSSTAGGPPCSGCGTLDPTATNVETYRAPANVPSPNKVFITATLQTTPPVSDSAMITVTPTVSVSPHTANVEFSLQAKFTATVIGTSNQGVTWSLDPSCSGCGTLDSATANPVTYTAPNFAITPNTVTLTATSQADPTQTDVAIITVGPVPPVLTQITPNRGPQGVIDLNVAITGQATHFGPTSTVTFSPDGSISARNIVVTDPTHLTATLNIPSNVATGPQSVTVTTGASAPFEVASLSNGFLVTSAQPGLVRVVDAGGDGGSFVATVGTADRFVAFLSTSTNLVSPPTNPGFQDVFLSDLLTLFPTTALVSARDGISPPTEGDSPENHLDVSGMSDDGLVVAFTTNSTNLVTPPTTLNRLNAFLRYTCAGIPVCTPSTVLASVNASGAETNGTSNAPPAVSPEGRYVLFTSEALDIVNPPLPPPAGPTTQLYLRDTCKNSDGTTISPCTAGSILISQTAAGAPFPSGSNVTPGYASSRGGRFAIFAAGGTQSGPLGQVFLRDTCGLPNNPVFDCTPSTTLVSQDTSGSPGFGSNGSSLEPSISEDGRFVVFESGASNFPGGLGGVYLRDTCRSINAPGLILGCNPTNAPLILISVATDGISPATGGFISTFSHSISADGRFILFGSSATNLVTNPPPASLAGQGVYVRDTCKTTTGPVSPCTPTTHLISVDSQGSFIDVRFLNAVGAGAAISRDGHFAVFVFRDSSANGRVALASTGF